MVGWILLIIALASFTFMLILAKDGTENREELIKDSFMLSAITTFMFAFVLFIAGLIFDSEIYEKEKVNIYSIEDNSKTNKRFTLGFGNEGEESYFYYMEDSEQIESIKKINTTDTKLVDENMTHPYIIKYGAKYKSNFAKWLYGEESLTHEGYKYELHVSKETVTTDFNIDIEEQ